MQTISKEEYTKLFKQVAHEILDGRCGDSKETIDAYINGIDMDAQYRGYFIERDIYPDITPLQEISKSVGGYYYMMYPDY